MSELSGPPLPPHGSGLSLLSTPDKSSCMDLSLVLFTENVDSMPVASDDGVHWGVWVDEAHQSHAHRLLEEIIEEQELQRIGSDSGDDGLLERAGRSGAFLNGAILGWTAFLLLVFLAGPGDAAPIKQAGILNKSVFAELQVYQLVTSVSLHRDFGHLALNMVSGWGFASLASWRYGGGVTLLGSLLSAVAANAFFAWLQRSSGVNWASLGASGMVFASLGMCIEFPFRPRFPSSPSLLRLISQHRSLFAAMGVIGLFGLSPDSNWIAHVGGFIGGAVLGFGLQRIEFLRRTLHQPATEALALFLFIALMFGSWVQALS